MKTKIVADKNGLGHYLDFSGKRIWGRVWWDGSGILAGKDGVFFREDATHKDRAKSLRRLAKHYALMAKELDVLDKKLKKAKLKKVS